MMGLKMKPVLISTIMSETAQGLSRRGLTYNNLTAIMDIIRFPVDAGRK